jgi:ribosome-binding protein aMBF1 (putative translation factor)
MGFNGYNKKLLLEIGRQLADEALPGGVMDDLAAMGKTVDDIFTYSTKLSTEFPTKTFDSIIDRVAKDNTIDSASVTNEMMRKFIATQMDEFMDIAAKIADESTTLKISDDSFQEVFTKAGLEEFPENLKNTLATKINDNTKGVTNQILDQYEKILDGNVTLKNTSQAKELSDKIRNKRAEILDYEDYKTKKSSNVGVAKNVDSGTDPQAYLKNLSQEELAAKLDYNPYWVSNEIFPEFTSGWKFHVFGAELIDSVFLKEKLWPVGQKWNSEIKVGGTVHNDGVTFPSMQPGGKQYGKQGATIYIPVDVVNSGRAGEMLRDIETAIAGYKKGGSISGDKELTPAIHYRYEYVGPVPKEGLPRKNARAMYNKNDGGPYKPDDVPDLFDSSVSKTASNVIPTTTNTLQSIIGDTSKINWAIIGNAKNVEDYNKFIDDAIATNDYMKISRRGFEEYGIPNFRTYLADLDLKAGDKSPARESGTPEQLYKINREIFDLYQAEGGTSDAFRDWLQQLPRNEMEDLYSYINSKKQ